MLALGVSAQAKKISKKVYDSMTDAAYSKFNKTPVRRRTSTNVMIVFGKEMNRRTVVEEYSPGRERVVTTIQFGEGKPLDKLEKREWIKIGTWLYELDENGNWSKSKSNSNSGRFFSDTAKDRADEYFVEVILIDQKQFKQITNRSTYRQENSDGNTEDWLDEYVTRVDESGRVVEQLTEGGIASPRALKRRSRSVFEYSPTDIKIVAPIK